MLNSPCSRCTALQGVMQPAELGAGRGQICLLLRGYGAQMRWLHVHAWLGSDESMCCACRTCKSEAEGRGRMAQPVLCRHVCPCAPLCMHAAVSCAPGPAGLDIAVEGVPDPPGACPPEVRGCCPCAPYARELRLGRSAAPVDCCAGAVLGAPVLFAGESVLPRSSTWLRELSPTSPACT